MTWQSSRGIVKSLSNICIQSNIPMTKPAKMPTAHWIIFAAGRAIATWNVFWRQKCCHTFITEAFCKMTHYYPNIQKLHAHTRSLGNSLLHRRSGQLASSPPPGKRGCRSSFQGPMSQLRKTAALGRPLLVRNYLVVQHVLKLTMKPLLPPIHREMCAEGFGC